jgi:hypothetical protein
LPRDKGEASLVIQCVRRARLDQQSRIQVHIELRQNTSGTIWRYFDVSGSDCEGGMNPDRLYWHFVAVKVRSFGRQQFLSFLSQGRAPRPNGKRSDPAPRCSTPPSRQPYPRRSQRRAAFSDCWRVLRSWDKLALGDSLAPRLLTAPLTVLSPGPRLAGTPSKGKKGNGTVESDVAVLRLLNGSRWQ